MYCSRQHVLVYTCMCVGGTVYSLGEREHNEQEALHTVTGTFKLYNHTGITKKGTTITSSPARPLPLPFLHATLKTWECPGDGASTTMQVVLKLRGKWTSLLVISLFQDLGPGKQSLFITRVFSLFNKTYQTIHTGLLGHKNKAWLFGVGEGK